MNEVPFMGYWPRWTERMDRLIEAIDLIKKLWTSDDYFTYDGKYFKMGNVQLYLKPRTRIPVYFSALGKKSAYMAGKHSDRLMTAGTVERCRDVILPKFNEGARSAGKDPARMEKAISIDGGIGSAAEIVNRIRKFSAGANVKGMFDERDPRIIEQAGRGIPDQQIVNGNYIRDRGMELIEIFSRFQRIGATQIIWDDFSADPDRMLEDFRTTIIPHFRERE